MRAFPCFGRWAKPKLGHEEFVSPPEPWASLGRRQLFERKGIADGRRIIIGQAELHIFVHLNRLLFSGYAGSQVGGQEFVGLLHTTLTALADSLANASGWCPIDSGLRRVQEVGPAFGRTQALPPD